MYTSGLYLRLRSQASLEALCEAFGTLLTTTSALDNTNTMAHRAMTTGDLPTFHSTASSPSLRSREPVEMLERPFTPPDGGDGGNVKVVVRVRKFIKRGRKDCNSGRVY